MSLATLILRGKIYSKSDDILRARNQKPVWLDTEELAEAPEIGYGHLPEDWESSA